MKELDNHNKLTDKQSTEVQVKKQVQVEYLHEGAVKPMPGHRVWEINVKTLEVKEAELVTNLQITWYEAIESMNGVDNREILKKKGYIYISALNQKQALSRYKKGKGSASLALEGKNFNIW